MFYKTYYFLIYFVIIIYIIYFLYDYNKKVPLVHLKTIKYLYNGEDLNKN